MSLSDPIIDTAIGVHRRVVQIVGEEILRDLAPWIKNVALPDLVTDAGEDDYPGRAARVEERVRARFREGQIEDAFRDIARAVEKNQTDKLKRIPGIDPARLLAGDGARRIEQFRRLNVALIESVPRRMVADVGRALRRTDVRRLHTSELADLIEERFGVSESRAELWARDQTLKLAADVQQSRQREAGVRRYIWRHSGDERVRGRPGGLWARASSDHWALGDTVQSWDSPPVVEERTGRRAHPGKDYQCRCTAEPYFDGSEDFTESEGFSFEVRQASPDAEVDRFFEETDE